MIKKNQLAKKVGILKSGRVRVVACVALVVAVLFGVGTRLYAYHVDADIAANVALNDARGGNGGERQYRSPGDKTDGVSPDDEYANLEEKTQEYSEAGVTVQNDELLGKLSEDDRAKLVEGLGLWGKHAGVDTSSATVVSFATADGDNRQALFTADGKFITVTWDGTGTWTVSADGETLTFQKAEDETSESTAGTDGADGADAESGSAEDTAAQGGSAEGANAGE